MKKEGFQAFADHFYGKEIACPKLYVLLLKEKIYHILFHRPTIRKTVFWYIFLLIHPSNKSSQLKMHFWREITEHVDVFTSNYIKAWKFSFKNFNFPFLTLYFLTPKAEQADGEALLRMNKETLKTLVPPAGVRAKFLHKIRKLDDKSTEVRIIHEVSTEVCTEARPVLEAVNAETVGEASSAPTVDKKRWEPIYSYNALVNLYGAGRRESWERYSLQNVDNLRKPRLIPSTLC